jgi:cytochrome c oxidase accessory protein FixG
MVISRHIEGKFRTARYQVELLLAAIYFGIPWIEWNGIPIMRLDIPGRKFHLLGSVFIPQEGYFLHLFLAIMGLSLFFFTTLIGRVWCGWACPQTVFTDFFDWIGMKILGSKYGKSDAPKAKTILLYVVWIVFSLIASFHWVAYFNSPYQMFKEIFTFTIAEGSSYHYAIAFFSFTLFGDMAFVREQFCKFACPYARFQTVLMDEHSYNVTYDHKRGEPRRNKTEKIGDCTACNMCLVVCPTGIDIRDGLNVGCIACAKCVDACTVQMEKEDKKTLILYDSMARIENKIGIKWIRSRSVIYGILLLIVSITMMVMLSIRVPLYVHAQPDKSVPPMIVEGNIARNIYKLNLINMDHADRDLLITAVTEKDGTPVKVMTGGSEPSIKVAGNGEAELRFILDVPVNKNTEKSMKIQLTVTDKINSKITSHFSVPLLLPLDWNGNE